MKVRVKDHVLGIYVRKRYRPRTKRQQKSVADALAMVGENEQAVADIARKVKGSNPLIDTEVVIHELVGDESLAGPMVGAGMARQHPIDRYSRWTGKELALDRALHNGGLKLDPADEETIKAEFEKCYGGTATA